MRAFPGRRSRTLLCEHPFRFGRLGEAFSPLDRQAYSIRPRQRYLLISRDCFGSSALDFDAQSGGQFLLHLVSHLYEGGCVIVTINLGFGERPSQDDDGIARLPGRDQMNVPKNAPLTPKGREAMVLSELV